MSPASTVVFQYALMSKKGEADFCNYVLWERGSAFGSTTAFLYDPQVSILGGEMLLFSEDVDAVLLTSASASCHLFAQYGFCATGCTDNWGTMIPPKICRSHH